MINKTRKPWLAGLLTVLSIGLGHMYSGNIKRGILLFFLGQAILVILTSFLLFPIIPLNILVAVFFALAFVIFCIVDAVRWSKKFRLSYAFKKYNKWYFYLLFVFITVFAIQPIIEDAIERNVVQAYKIPSGAMKPTLLLGDHILVKKLYYNETKLSRGDIVVFKYPVDPKKSFVKRLIGTPGDVIEIRDKILYVNHERLNYDRGVFTDPNIIPANIRPRDNLGPITVPQNSIFVLGDNRDQSFDSRFWGFVDLDAILGKAFAIYWSWDKNNSTVRWDRIGKKIE